MRFGTFEAHSIDLDQFWKYRHMQRKVAMPQSVLEIAKDLTLTLVEAGSVSADNMQDMLQKTYATLAALKAREETGSGTARTQEPVDWRQSITRHSITCLECGASFRQLAARHLQQHGLDARSYRAKYSIPTTQPLAARATAALRRRIAAEVKPWEKSPTYRKGQETRAATVKKSARKKGRRVNIRLTRVYSHNSLIYKGSVK
jgi:predicted transcriptional regulator